MSSKVTVFPLRLILSFAAICCEELSFISFTLMIFKSLFVAVIFEEVNSISFASIFTSLPWIVVSFPLILKAFSTNSFAVWKIELLALTCVLAAFAVIVKFSFVAILPFVLSIFPVDVIVKSSFDAIFPFIFIRSFVFNVNFLSA